MAGSFGWRSRRQDLASFTMRTRQNYEMDTPWDTDKLAGTVPYRRRDVKRIIIGGLIDGESRPEQRGTPGRDVGWDASGEPGEHDERLPRVICGWTDTHGNREQRARF